jgi:hypothetical protein
MKRNLLDCAFRVLLMAITLSSTPASSAPKGSFEGYVLDRTCGRR